MKFNFGFIEEWKNLEQIQKSINSGCSIVFYAENKASMNHFKLLLLELTEVRNLRVCYVTSIKNDSVFSLKNKNISAYYIGDGITRTKFFLTLKAKILIMDMPDLETFHIKRSKVYPVHYIYIFHSMFSIHSYLRKGAIDHYDTIFCVGEHHEKEILETEKIYNLQPKKLLKYGFGRLDTLLSEKEKFQQMNTNNEKLIIISPSYGKNNLLNICGIELIEILLKMNFKVLLRPHFIILRDSNELIKKIHSKFDSNPNFIMENGVISADNFHNSICMISDWSGISFEYAFTFERPVIFIDVPKKILNSYSDDISIEPVEISIRSELGYVVSPKELEKIPELIEMSNDNNKNIQEKIKLLRSKTVFNIGKSKIIGANYIEELINKLS